MQPTFLRILLLTGLLLHHPSAAPGSGLPDSPVSPCINRYDTSRINCAGVNLGMFCFLFNAVDMSTAAGYDLDGHTNVEWAKSQQALDQELLELREDQTMQKRLNLIFLLTIILTFIVVIILVNGYQRNRKQKQLLEEKNDLLAETNLKLEKSDTELREMYNEQTKLFSIVAHDLRNPISAVRGFAELIEEKYDVLDDETRKEYIEQISHGTFRTLSLLENLLLWARSQMDLVKVEKVDIAAKDLIHSGANHMMSLVEKKNLVLNIDIRDDIILHVDPEMTKAVIRNLISNAIKFSYPGCEITISCFIDGGMHCISIRDHGTGIDPQLKNALGCTGSNPSTVGTAKETGSGLGLLISKDYTKKNGGTIEIDSEPGKGSLFTICFPAIQD